MKKLLLLSALIISLVVLTRCDDDDDEPTIYYSATGTFIKGDSFYFASDGGSKMEISSSSSVNEDDFDNDSTRAIIVFVKQEDYEEGDYDLKIKITDYDEILTKSIFHFTTETEESVRDSIGNDIVRVEDAWITDNYLTIYFSYNGYSGMHYINLVQDEDSLVNDDGDLILELKHNANDDLNYYHWHGMASFDISELQDPDADAVSLLLRYIKNSDGDYGEVSIVYDYGDSSSGTEILSVSDEKEMKISTNVVIR